MKTVPPFLLILFLMVTPCSFAQLAGTESASIGAEKETAPRSFRAYALGMKVDELKSALASDSNFAFRGDRDVSLLPSSQDILIDTVGLSFVRRATFLFHEGVLYIMSFDLNPEKLDHYSVFTSLEAKYGPPVELDPKASVWRSSTTRTSLERPLTLKYVDLGVFDALKNDSEVGLSGEATLRQEFLDDL